MAKKSERVGKAEDTGSVAERPVWEVLPKLGETVAYYRNGDSTQEPQVAIVSRITATGLTLHVFQISGPMLFRESVRHVLDPWHEERPDRKHVRFERGCWSSWDLAQERQEAEQRRKAELLAKQRQSEEATRQMLADMEPLLEDVAMEAEELARQGFALPDIAEHFRGRCTIGQLKNHFETHSISA